MINPSFQPGHGGEGLPGGVGGTDDPSPGNPVSMAYWCRMKAGRVRRIPKDSNSACAARSYWIPDPPRVRGGAQSPRAASFQTASRR